MSAMVLANCIRIRSPFIYGYCPVLQTKIFNYRHFADDVKQKKLYETLGVSPSATHNEIKKAYYDLTLKYHPDRSENCEEAAVKFREITAAYEILGNFRLRKRYDKGIPVARVKEKVRPTVEHKAQFQEFFDSRVTTNSSTSDARSREIRDLGTYTKKSSDKEEAEKADASFVSTVKLQHLVTAVLCIFIFLAR